MSFLPSSTLLQSLTIRHGNNSAPPITDGDQKAGKIRSKGSIANLIQLVRNPIDTVGEAVEDWYEGNTREERIKQQVLEDKKQILYLRLRNVGLPRLVLSRHQGLMKCSKGYVLCRLESVGDGPGRDRRQQ